jgi:hypothetical protein
MATMQYPFTAIADSDIPRAVKPVFQHLLDTYASETNKVISVWRSFAPADLTFRPHPKSSTVADILKHQLLFRTPFFWRICRDAGAGAGRSVACDTRSRLLHHAPGGTCQAATDVFL